MANTFLRKRISFKLSFILAGILLILSLLAEIPVYTITKSRVQNAVNGAQFSKARHLAQEVDLRIEQRVKFLAALSRLITSEQIQNHEGLDTLLAKYKDMMDYFPQGLGILRPDGKCMLAKCLALQETTTQNFDKSEWFIRASQQDGVVISKPLKCGSTGKPLIVFAVGIKDSVGGLAGVLVAPTFLDSTNFLDFAYPKDQGQFSQVLIISRTDNIFIATPNADMILKPAPRPETLLANPELLKLSSGAGLITNESGTQDVFAFANTRVLDWVMIVRTPSELAFTPVRDEVIKDILTNLFFICITIFTIFATLRIYFRPLKYAAEQVRTMGDRASLPHLPKERDDEIGDLIVGFNTLVDTVNERTSQLEKANAKLEALSHTDALTEVFNRRWFDHCLAHSWRVHMRNKQPLSLIFLDVDYFKQYNDLYGHIEGDECLSTIAKALSATLHRPTDIFARYGGEEFAAIVANTTEEAMHLAQTMRKTVMDLGLKHEKSAWGVVTISLGVATLVPNRDSGADMLINHADTALYKSKENGRNRVEFFSPEGESS